MTLQEMKLLFAFNAWASNKILDAVGALPEENITRDMKTSHKTILQTLVHMVGAEKVWLERWSGKPDAKFLTPSDYTTLASVKELWNTVGFTSAKFVAGLTDKKLQELFEMKTMKGDVFKTVYWQSMLHVIDHSTYHRGQIVAMLRQLDVVPPSTGMIGFFRETAKLKN
jgi:uncharacterized damage-inducible protein DinB